MSVTPLTREQMRSIKGGYPQGIVCNCEETGQVCTSTVQTDPDGGISDDDLTWAGIECCGTNQISDCGTTW